MKKKVNFTGKGLRTKSGNLALWRVLPNQYADAVGPFVFLDHLIPTEHTALHKSGTGARPHRGIATLSYVLAGEAEHFDNVGNYAVVHSGGVQWMKAGRGIVHDETLNADSRTGSNVTHALQFWVNLPAKNKAEPPAYRALESEQVPCKALPQGQGWVKVLLGAFEELSAALPSYSEQFLYHFHLAPGAAYALRVAEGHEVAAFLPTRGADLNDECFSAGDFVEFDRAAGGIGMRNEGPDACDILLFGGEPYSELCFAHGPFVMNTSAEVAEAYKDYHSGKYGEIHYPKEWFLPSAPICKLL